MDNRSSVAFLRQERKTSDSLNRDVDPPGGPEKRSFSSGQRSATARDPSLYLQLSDTR
jgi:hypothetical protein